MSSHDVFNIIVNWIKISGERSDEKRRELFANLMDYVNFKAMDETFLNNNVLTDELVLKCPGFEAQIRKTTDDQEVIFSA